MARRSWWSAGLGLGLSIAASGCGGEGESGGGGPAAEEVESRPVDRALANRLPAGASLDAAEQGRELFAVCATCHGFEGEGTQLGPSLRDTVWIQPGRELPQIEQVIRDGVAAPAEFPVPMPPHGGGRFTDEQIRAVATYVYLLSQGGE